MWALFGKAIKNAATNFILLAQFIHFSTDTRDILCRGARKGSLYASRYISMQISWLRSEIKKKGGARKLWERAVYRRMSQECPRLQSGCVMAVSVFSFQTVFNASYASLFAMELQKLLVTEWQNHSFVSNEYVSVSCIIPNVTNDENRKRKQLQSVSIFILFLHLPF